MSNVEIINSHNFEEKEKKPTKKYDTPLNFVPFGKYAKVPFEDVLKITELRGGKIIETGKNYLIWLEKQAFINEDLKNAINSHLK